MGLVEQAGGKIRVVGRIQKIRFYDEEKGFYILSVLPQGKDVRGAQRPVSVKGYGVDLAEGKDIQAEGKMVASRSPAYPPSLEAESLSELLPQGLDGIRKYLSAGFIPGIGKVMADALIQTFGAQVFEIIEKTPERLIEVPGVGEGRAAALVKAMKTQNALRRIMPFMMENGLGPAMAMRVHRALGDNAPYKIRKNPYCLTKVPMFGFKRADEVAKKLGLALDSKERIQAALQHVLITEADDRGNTAVAYKRLVEMAKKLLDDAGRAFEILAPQIQSVLDRDIARKTDVVERELAGGVRTVSLMTYARQEEAIAARLVEMLAAPADELISGDYRDHPSFSHLDPSQLDAAHTSLRNRISVITGRPGCGKTTVTKAVLDVMTSMGLSCALCAPTGRAAKRMTEATGYPASTIHRTYKGGHNGFRHNEANPIPFSVVCIDELSMATSWLMDKSVRGTKKDAHMILVGDPDQLPSIGAGNVLADMIRSGVVPVSTLTEIHRNAQDSNIIKAAHAIINGEVPVSVPEKGDFVIIPAHGPEKQVKAILEQYDAFCAQGIDPSEIQILTPMLSRGGVGADDLNALLKERMNPAGNRPSVKRMQNGVEITFSEGDRVMYTVNETHEDADGNEIDVSNGEIGYIKAIDKAMKTLTVDFLGVVVEMDLAALDDFKLAYASTIHKAQGSEFKAVIVPISKAQSYMMDRNLLYTAATRGKDNVILIGDEYMLKTIVAKTQNAERMTGLRECLVQAANEAKNKLEIVPPRRKRVVVAGCGF